MKIFSHVMMLFALSRGREVSTVSRVTALMALFIGACFLIYLGGRIGWAALAIFGVINAIVILLAIIAIIAYNIWRNRYRW